jgi:hypothetical protein
VPPLDADDGKLVYGYVGRRPIAGRLTVRPARWSGTFRFLGQHEPFTVGGLVHPREAEDGDDTSPYDGRAQHQYLDCELDVGGSGLTGSLDAACLDEGEVLEVRGSFSPLAPKGAPALRDEPFFVRTAPADRPDPDAYYAALVATPTDAHACAPFVELVELTPRPSERVALLYTLRWPCDERPAEERAYPSTGQNPPPPTWQAFVAEVTPGETPQLVSSTFWTTLGDPDDPNELTMELRAVELTRGFDLYLATLTDQFDSPTSSGGNTTVSTVAWAVAADGRYGPTTALANVESGHQGVCYAVSSSRDLWLVDLDGNAVPELVSRTVTDETVDRLVNGQLECAQGKVKTEWASYAFDPTTMAWRPRPAPKKLRDAQLAAGRKLDVP